MSVEHGSSMTYPELCAGLRDRLQLDEGALVPLVPPLLGEAMGIAALRYKERTYVVACVHDYGWRCIDNGEIDEDGVVIREPRGISLLDEWLVDVETGFAHKVDTQVEDDHILGVAYAAAMFSEGGDSHYADYVRYFVDTHAPYLAAIHQSPEHPTHSLETMLDAALKVLSLPS